MFKEGGKIVGENAQALLMTPFSMSTPKVTTYKAYRVEDFQITKTTKNRKVCQECVNDDDRYFVFRCVNGYRLVKVYANVPALPMLKLFYTLKSDEKWILILYLE